MKPLKAEVPHFLDALASEAEPSRANRSTHRSIHESELARGGAKSATPSRNVTTPMMEVQMFSRWKWIALRLGRRSGAVMRLVQTEMKMARMISVWIPNIAVTMRVKQAPASKP